METEVSAAAGLAVAAVAPQSIEGSPFILVPAGYELKDLDRLLGRPTRKHGSVGYHDVDSFTRAVNEQKGAGTRIYGSKQTPAFKAIFNDIGEEPGWRDHVATYACPLSVEWKIWTGANKRQMTQEQFAQFIEDNAPDCVSPDSATMIEISRTLEAKKKVNFASGIRLSNGQNELTYEEAISGTAGKGKFQVPEAFQIGVAVLEGGAKYAVNARLRYRIGEQGALVMWYDLERPHKVLEDAAKDVWAQIESATSLAVFNGG